MDASTVDEHQEEDAAIGIYKTYVAKHGLFRVFRSTFQEFNRIVALVLPENPYSVILGILSSQEVGNLVSNASAPQPAALGDMKIDVVLLNGKTLPYPLCRMPSEKNPITGLRHLLGHVHPLYIHALRCIIAAFQIPDIEECAMTSPATASATATAASGAKTSESSRMHVESATAVVIPTVLFPNIIKNLACPLCVREHVLITCTGMEHGSQVLARLVYSQVRAIMGNNPMRCSLQRAVLQFPHLLDAEDQEIPMDVLAAAPQQKDESVRRLTDILGGVLEKCPDIKFEFFLDTATVSPQQDLRFPSAEFSRFTDHRLVLVCKTLSVSLKMQSDSRVVSISHFTGFPMRLLLEGVFLDTDSAARYISWFDLGSQPMEKSILRMKVSYATSFKKTNTVGKSFSAAVDALLPYLLLQLTDSDADGPILDELQSLLGSQFVETCQQVQGSCCALLANESLWGTCMPSQIVRSLRLLVKSIALSDALCQAPFLEACIRVVEKVDGQKMANKTPAVNMLKRLDDLVLALLNSSLFLLFNAKHLHVGLWVENQFQMKQFFHYPSLAETKDTDQVLSTYVPYEVRRFQRFLLVPDGVVTESVLAQYYVDSQLDSFLQDCFQACFRSDPLTPYPLMLIVDLAKQRYMSYRLSLFLEAVESNRSLSISFSSDPQDVVSASTTSSLSNGVVSFYGSKIALAMFAAIEQPVFRELAFQILSVVVEKSVPPFGFEGPTLAIMGGSYKVDSCMALRLPCVNVDGSSMTSSCCSFVVEELYIVEGPDTHDGLLYAIEVFLTRIVDALNRVGTATIDAQQTAQFYPLFVSIGAQARVPVYELLSDLNGAMQKISTHLWAGDASDVCVEGAVGYPSDLRGSLVRGPVCIRWAKYVKFAFRSSSTRVRRDFSRFGVDRLDSCLFFSKSDCSTFEKICPRPPMPSAIQHASLLELASQDLIAVWRRSFEEGQCYAFMSLSSLVWLQSVKGALSFPEPSNLKHWLKENHHRLQNGINLDQDRAREETETEMSFGKSIFYDTSRLSFCISNWTTACAPFLSFLEMLETALPLPDFLEASCTAQFFDLKSRSRVLLENRQWYNCFFYEDLIAAHRVFSSMDPSMFFSDSMATFRRQFASYIRLSVQNAATTVFRQLSKSEAQARQLLSLVE
eukprot:ANDGO_05712.mRNA.1 hypothetical protein